MSGGLTVGTSREIAHEPAPRFSSHSRGRRRRDRAAALAPAARHVLLSVAGPALAAPFVPTDPDQVLERLPLAATDSKTRELQGLRRQLAERPDDLDLALRVARRNLEIGRTEADPALLRLCPGSAGPLVEPESAATRGAAAARRAAPEPARLRRGAGRPAAGVGGATPPSASLAHPSGDPAGPGRTGGGVAQLSRLAATRQLVAAQHLPERGARPQRSSRVRLRQPAARAGERARGRYRGSAVGSDGAGGNRRAARRRLRRRRRISAMRSPWAGATSTCSAPTPISCSTRIARSRRANCCATSSAPTIFCSDWRWRNGGWTIPPGNVTPRYWKRGLPPLASAAMESTSPPKPG
jgi:hypothetical protein